MDDFEYRFVIGAYTPETIPMARLADYMADLAKLLGETAAVHFVRLERGSCALVQRIEREAVPKVQQRIVMVARGDAPLEAMNAFDRLNVKLSADSGRAELQDQSGHNVLEFPGAVSGLMVAVTHVSQAGSLDGRVIRIGGKNDEVTVHLQNGEIAYRCKTSRETAIKIAPYIFTTDIRVHGFGRWIRGEDEGWSLDYFTISDFTVLDADDLLHVVSDIHKIQGNEWSSVVDPWRELDLIRNGSEPN